MSGDPVMARTEGRTNADEAIVVSAAGLTNFGARKPLSTMILNRMIPLTAVVTRYGSGVSRWMGRTFTRAVSIGLVHTV